jgi:biotin carboxyl carrier protein
MKLNHRGETYDIRIEDGTLHIVPGNGDARAVPVAIELDRIRLGKRLFPFRAVRDRKGIWVHAAGRTEYFEIAIPTAISGVAGNEIRSPMTGRVVSVHVEQGADVAEGDLLAVVTAMKMEFRIESPRAARVAEVASEADALVELGDLLVRLEDAE